MPVLRQKGLYEKNQLLWRQGASESNALGVGLAI
jgi:hypothetical protein